MVPELREVYRTFALACWRVLYVLMVLHVGTSGISTCIPAPKGAVWGHAASQTFAVVCSLLREVAILLDVCFPCL